MNTLLIPYYKVKKIKFSGEGLSYLDEHNNECFIDFYICRSNWVSFVNNSGEFRGKHISESDTKCVALRDRSNHPPYIEFFADPRTRFEFSPGLLDRLINPRRLSNDFLEMQNAILKAGWSSFDYS